MDNIIIFDLALLFQIINTVILIFIFYLIYKLYKKIK